MGDNARPDLFDVERAAGAHYVDSRGRRVLDFFGASGALTIGHNHPRILAVRRRFAEPARADSTGSGYTAALAARLARIAPGDLEVVHLCSTGSAALGVALTLAQRARVPGRSEVAHVSRVRGERRVPFGDADALADALRKRRIGTVILETVHSDTGVDPPRPDYLNQVRRLCDEHGALWIADETNCGIGRTGRLFAFEHAGVVPDLVTLAKSLGGGEAVVGAALVRGPIHRRARPDAAPASPPGALGTTAQAYCTALETLAVLDDEDLIGNAERTGRYLLRRLEGLRQCYPHLVSAVRGQGLLVGVHLPGLTGVVGTLLLAEHGVLVAFSDQKPDHKPDHNREMLRLEPPLNIRPEHVDHFVDALDELLSRGPRQLTHDYRRAVRTWQPEQLSPYGDNYGENYGENY